VIARAHIIKHKRSQHIDEPSRNTFGQGVRFGKLQWISYASLSRRKRQRSPNGTNHHLQPASPVAAPQQLKPPKAFSLPSLQNRPNGAVIRPRLIPLASPRSRRSPTRQLRHSLSGALTHQLPVIPVVPEPGVHLLVEMGRDEVEPDLHVRAVLGGSSWCQGRWDGLLDLWSRRERWRGRGRRRRGLSDRRIGGGGGGEEAADRGARPADEGFDAVFQRHGFLRWWWWLVVCMVALADGAFLASVWLCW
jgi:hypothetical protein